MTTDKSRADALTDERAAFEAKFPMPPDCVWTGNGYSQTRHDAWRATAYANMWEGWKARAVASSEASLAPIAGERELFEKWAVDTYGPKGATRDERFPNSYLYSSPDDAWAGWQAAWQARAASANETGAEGAAVAWMRIDDPRDCISDAKKRDMIEHAGAPGARLAEKYSIALGVITPAQAAEPCAWLVEWTPNVSDKVWVQSFVNELDAINKQRQVGGRVIACAPINALSHAPAHAAEPVAWQYRPIVNGKPYPWIECTKEAAQRLRADDFRGTHEVRDLFDTPQPPAQADARPTDDELWDQTLSERDEYHEMADKLAAAIAKHFGVDIGEHSNANCPWEEALEVIENAAQTDAREGLTDEQREVFGGNFGALEQAENLCRATGNDSSAEGLKALSHALHAFLKGVDHAE
ncbi:hypothetical protein [Burkholderia multivorans]|uniref:hypothetical protein n=1 Tax=Burkholderia multivorans TaxID=87883 RepID=UPI0021C0A7AD|nr:hypothetical protein [Burkholderia multivorans]